MFIVSSTKCMLLLFVPMGNPPQKQEASRVPKTWKFYFQSDWSLMFFSSFDSLWITACFFFFFRYKESNGTKKKPTSIISYIISPVFKTGMSKWEQRPKCWTFILSLFLIGLFLSISYEISILPISNRFDILT